MAGGRVDQRGILTIRVKLKNLAEKPMKNLADGKNNEVKEEQGIESKWEKENVGNLKKVKSLTGMETRKKEIKPCQDEESTSSLVVTRQCVGFLLRGDGSLVKKIMKDSGAQIEVVGEKKDEMRPIIIKGPAESRSRAEAALMKAWQVESTSFMLNRRDAGFLLHDGKVKKLETKYGVFIRICGEVADRRRTVVIEGEEGRRAEAKAAIMETLESSFGEIGEVMKGSNQDKVIKTKSFERGGKEVKDFPENREMKTEKGKNEIGEVKTEATGENLHGDEVVVVRKVEAIYMTLNQGRQRMEFEAISGARIRVNLKVSASNFMAVGVRGRREQVEEAKDLIARLGRNTLQVPVTGREVDAIIREHLTNKVQRSTGACLWVVQGMRVVVAGSMEEVARARATLEELLGRDT